jgi:hypothetical protein
MLTTVDAFVVHHLLAQMAILRPGIYNDVNIQRNTVEMVVRSLGPVGQ